MIYNILIHIHSVARWLLLVSIIIALVNALLKYRKKSLARCGDCAFNRITLILAHLQLVAGLVLYFISPKVIFNAASMRDSVLRFFLVEHIGLMIVAIVLITVGYVKSEKVSEDRKKYKSILIYFGIAFLLLLAAIPWPFRNLGAGWF